MDKTQSSNITAKVIVITGASSGTGAATARHLAGLGAAVVLGRAGPIGSRRWRASCGPRAAGPER